MSPELLIQFFRYLNRFMVFMWRLGLGPWLNAWPKVLGRYVVITHIGRKSGQRRRTPVNYAEIDGDIYCVAGFGAKADWYRNMVANPQVEVWLPGGWWQGTAEEMIDADTRMNLMRQVLIGSGFAAFAAGIDPYKISDAELARATVEYRLMRIRRAAACTGPGGPGDLAWCWPLAVLLMLPLLIFLLFRPRHK